jgi:hypothetical protein
MAVQSSPSQQSLEDHLRTGQNVNTENLSMSAPKFYCGLNFIVIILGKSDDSEVLK